MQISYEVSIQIHLNLDDGLTSLAHTVFNHIELLTPGIINFFPLTTLTKPSS